VTGPEEIQTFDAAAPDPAETKTATFALGCFWGPNVTVGAVEGVVRTRVGMPAARRPTPPTATSATTARPSRSITTPTPSPSTNWWTSHDLAVVVVERDQRGDLARERFERRVGLDVLPDGLPHRPRPGRQPLGLPDVVEGREIRVVDVDGRSHHRTHDPPRYDGSPEPPITTPYCLDRLGLAG
jgi:hypothetical protein